MGSRILGFSLDQEGWNMADLDRCLCLPKASLLASSQVPGWKGRGGCTEGVHFPGHPGKCSLYVPCFADLLPLRSGNCSLGPLRVNEVIPL